MIGAAHYLAAENMLTAAADQDETLDFAARALLVNAALAHATLAQAAATAMAAHSGGMDDADFAVWDAVCGVHDEDEPATVTAIRDRP